MQGRGMVLPFLPGGPPVVRCPLSACPARGCSTVPGFGDRCNPLSDWRGGYHAWGAVGGYRCRSGALSPVPTAQPGDILFAHLDGLGCVREYPLEDRP